MIVRLYNLLSYSKSINMRFRVRSTRLLKCLTLSSQQARFIDHKRSPLLISTSLISYTIHRAKVKQPHNRPTQALRGPGGWGSQICRQSAHEGGKVVSPTHRPPLPPKEIFLVLISVRGWVDPRAIVRPKRLCQGINSIDTIGNRTRNVPVCSVVPQPTTPPRAPLQYVILHKCIYLDTISTSLE
jgi:hypothetical protein